MKTINSIAIFALVPFANFCGQQEEIVKPVKEKNILVVKTIDGFGKPVKSSLVYESRDCEYDFENPLKTNSNALGITKLKVPTGYLQLYADGFLHESYRCFTYSGLADTITIYAAKLPTFVETRIPNAVITYFPNTSGDCEFVNNPINANTVIADATGKATIYFLIHDTYKIQVGAKVECFQNDQEIHTVKF